jgi:hypothetical protein
VLRPGGVYRVVVENPATAFANWDGEAYRISKPYLERVNLRQDAMESGRYMGDIFNGLLDSGFSIQRVRDAPYYWQENPQAQRASWTHQRTSVAGESVIVATKEQRNL